MHVFDGNQPFRSRNASGQAFGDGGLARAGLADNEEVAIGFNRQVEEFHVPLVLLQIQQ